MVVIRTTKLWVKREIAGAPQERHILQTKDIVANNGTFQPVSRVPDDIVPARSGSRSIYRPHVSHKRIVYDRDPPDVGVKKDSRIIVCENALQDTDVDAVVVGNRPSVVETFKPKTGYLGRPGKQTAREPICVGRAGLRNQARLKGALLTDKQNPVGNKYLPNDVFTRCDQDGIERRSTVHRGFDGGRIAGTIGGYPPRPRVARPRSDGRCHDGQRKAGYSQAGFHARSWKSVLQTAFPVENNGLIVGSLTGMREGDFVFVSGRFPEGAVGKLHVYKRHEFVRVDVPSEVSRPARQ